MHNDLKTWIETNIIDLVEQSAENDLQTGQAERAWGKPLIGFSRGDDPYYQFFKEDIGAFYWLPIEIFSQTFPELEVKPGDLTVISWVLPQTDETKRDQKKETCYPGERWSRSRLYGEAFNVQLRNHVACFLNQAGFHALPPMEMETWKRETSDKYGDASSWSERHTAFVCGLGTFGLSDGLITPLGKAVRFGSVIARLKVSPTERPYQTHNAYCLFYDHQKCTKCADRCPVNAITEAGHDKVSCRQYIREVTAPYNETAYGLTVNSCGLCQAGVPCASKIPVKSFRNNSGFVIASDES